MKILRNLNQSSSGRRISGIPWVGVTASEIPTGFPFPALLVNDIDTGVPDRLYSVEILAFPVAGNYYFYEDSSLSFVGAPDGSYSGGVRVRKYDPASGLVSAEDTTYTFNIGGGHYAALILSDGRAAKIPAAQIGTGKKALVLANGRFKQRQSAEGTPVILVNGRLRKLQPGETLDI